MEATFLLQDIYTIHSDSVAVGEVKFGIVKVGMICDIQGTIGRVKSIEQFRNILQEAPMGANVGLYLEGIDSALLTSQKDNILTFKEAEGQSIPQPPITEHQEATGIIGWFLGLFKK